MCVKSNRLDDHFTRTGRTETVGTNADEWGDYPTRRARPFGWRSLLLVAALAFILGIASGAAGMEWLYFQWRP